MNVCLYSTLFGDMLKTSKENAMGIYKKLKLSMTDFTGLLEITIHALNSGNYITNNIKERLHLLYNQILDDYPESRTLIIESYNRTKDILNTCKTDKYELFIYDDILRRELGIFHNDPLRLYDNKQNNFYADHYDELMDDIAFDYYVINYLLDSNAVLDNEMCKDSRFLKSMRYVIWSIGDSIDNLTIIKVIQTLKYRETILDDNIFKKINIIGQQNKLIKRLGGLYGK